MWPSKQHRTLGGILRKVASEVPDKEFLVFSERSLTYSEFDGWVDRVASGLLSTGLRKGDKLGIMLPNCPEFVALWFGCGRIGAVEVPINTSTRGNLLVHMLNLSDAKVLVIAAEHLEQLQQVAHLLAELKTVVILSGEANIGARLPFRVLPFRDIDPASADLADVEVLPEDPLAIVFTSGTTGPSKGALLPHNYYWWFAEQCCNLRDVTPAERLYTCLPLFHANAQVLTVVTAMMRSATAILDTNFTASGFWERMRKFEVTQFNYIGGMIPILLKQPPRPLDREHSVRFALGAAAPKGEWLAFEERFGTRLIECYGQSEDCAVTCNPLDAVRVGSIGKPMWGHEIQVVDENDHVVEDGMVGEFVVRPKHPNIMMSGYYKMPLETLEAFRHLWFHTGDLGSRDSDGYFYFKDRKKDAIRRRGENISAYEVEMAVNAHPAVLESAAFAVPSEVGEDDVMLVVILKQDHTLTPLELIQHCERELSYFAVPRYVDFRTEMPKTPTYRVEKYRLRQQGVTPSTWDREQSGYQIRRK